MSKNIIHYKDKKVTIDIEFAEKYVKLAKKVEKEAECLKEMKEQLVEELLNVHVKTGQTNIVSNGIASSYIKAYDKSKFDVSALKKDDIDTYNKYAVSTHVNPTVKVSVTM